MRVGVGVVNRLGLGKYMGLGVGVGLGLVFTKRFPRVTFDVAHESPVSNPNPSRASPHLSLVLCLLVSLFFVLTMEVILCEYLYVKF